MISTQMLVIFVFCDGDYVLLYCEFRLSHAWTLSIAVAGEALQFNLQPCTLYRDKT